MQNELPRYRTSLEDVLSALFISTCGGLWAGFYYYVTGEPGSPYGLAIGLALYFFYKWKFPTYIYHDAILYHNGSENFLIFETLKRFVNNSLPDNEEVAQQAKVIVDNEMADLKAIAAKEKAKQEDVQKAIAQAEEQVIAKADAKSITAIERVAYSRVTEIFGINGSGKSWFTRQVAFYLKTEFGAIVDVIDLKGNGNGFWSAVADSVTGYGIGYEMQAFHDISQKMKGLESSFFERKTFLDAGHKIPPHLIIIDDATTLAGDKDIIRPDDFLRQYRAFVSILVNQLRFINVKLIISGQMETIHGQSENGLGLSKELELQFNSKVKFSVGAKGVRRATVMLPDGTKAVTYDVGELTDLSKPHLALPAPAPLPLPTPQLPLPVQTAPAVSFEKRELVTQLPENISLFDILPSEGASLKRIIFGVTLDNGQLKPLAVSLEEFVHGAIAGSSGWGKSVMGRVIGYQLAVCPEPCQLVFIDIEGVTFPVFAKSERLRYQLCDTVDGAVTIAKDLIGELNRRKGLYQNYPMVEKLSEYNEVAHQGLPPIVVLIDESTTLFKLSGEFETHITELALRSRKYGIYLILLGQDFKADTLSTTIRNQLSNRIQLKAQDTTQSKIMIGSPIAKTIKIKGRAYALLSGQDMVEIQTPYLSKVQACNIPTKSTPESNSQLPNDPNFQKYLSMVLDKQADLKPRDGRIIPHNIATIIGKTGGEHYKYASMIADYLNERPELWGA